MTESVCCYREVGYRLMGRYPNPISFPRGCILWSRRLPEVSDQDLLQFDITVDHTGKPHYSPLGPRVVKFHTPFFNDENFSIAAAGMAGVNSFVWEKVSYSPAIKNMITEAQVETICILFGFFSIHFSIPVEEIRTRAEYAKTKGLSKKNPDGFYPQFWDFDGMGDELRERIWAHKEKFLLLYPQF